MIRIRRTGFLWISSFLIFVIYASGCTQPGPTPVTPTETTTPAPPPTPILSPIAIEIPAQPDILAATPPMGWNSFNHFGCSVDEVLVRETADAMVESGMAAAGYEFVNIDDCWMAKTRDADGNLQGDPEKFPHGIKALADYVHSKGLKLGIYLDRGTETCGHFPGSFGFEVQDANQVASWGIDYVKYDNCAPVGKLMDDYTRMHDALVATGRPIVFSMCSWGFPGMLVAEQDIAQLWRTSSDIKDTWDSMIRIGEANNAYSPYAQPGHWNDPDMLEVGNGGMTDIEYRTHFSLWAIMAAPLIAGNDLRTMDQATRDILTAPEVIAVNQDPHGMQGTFLSNLVTVEGLEVWSKPLAEPNVRAVLFLNRTEMPATIAVRWQDLGLLSGAAEVRDLWDRADRGIYFGEYAHFVPPHGIVLIRVRPAEGQFHKSVPPQ